MWSSTSTQGKDGGEDAWDGRRQERRRSSITGVGQTSYSFDSWQRDLRWKQENKKYINYCGEDFAGAKIGCNLNIKSPTRWINLGLNSPWIASWKESILDMLHNRKIIWFTFDTKLIWCIIQLIFITIWTFSICWFLLARPLIIYFYGWQLFVLIPAACQLWIVIILADCHQIFGFPWKNYLIL